MKPNIVAFVLMFCAATLCADTVGHFEYFFDADPGQGNGIQVYGRNTLDYSAAISTAALSSGFHRVYTRAVSGAGKWGMPQRVSFYIPFQPQTNVTPNGTITHMEYFFDTDPGVGNGIQIYGRNTVDVAELISTAALSPGFHRIYVRARSATGKWGQPQRSVFYIPVPRESNVTPNGTITRIEYFFDTDPGVGNGIQIYGRNTVDVNQMISTAALSPGFHRIYVRSRSLAGKWGMPQRTAFYIPVPRQPRPPVVNITHLEYYLDTDPGTGQGTLVSLNPGMTVNQTVSLDMTGIPDGNHTLFIRLRNSTGTWGLPASCLFSNGIPAHLTAIINNGMITIAWEDLYTIDSYRVYSAPEPYGAYALESGGVFGPSDWTSPLPTNPKRFYRVTSIYDEP